MDRPAAGIDRREAEYFLLLLAQICKRTNLQIVSYQRAIEVAVAAGRHQQACELRELMGMTQQDREILADLIDRLQVSADASVGEERDPAGCHEGSRVRQRP